MTMDRFPDKFLGRLAGKTAIVTGAGAKGEGFGTGRAMGVLFVGEGARVGLIDRDEQALARTQAYADQVGGEAISIRGDVTSEEDCRTFIAQTVEAFGRLDILVNNVGIASGSCGVDVLDMSDWQRVLDINLKSAVLMSKAAVPAMREAGGGVILNIVSIAGMLAYGGLAYGASKAAMIQLTRDLALVHGKDGIRVNAIAPGHIYTPLVEDLLPAEMRESRRKAGPLGIEGDAWDIARAALYLASDDARFVTGVCLPVDGGVTSVGSLQAASMIGRD